MHEAEPVIPFAVAAIHIPGEVFVPDLGAAVGNPTAIGEKIFQYTLDDGRVFEATAWQIIHPGEDAPACLKAFAGLSLEHAEVALEMVGAKEKVVETADAQPIAPKEMVIPKLEVVAEKPLKLRKRTGRRMLVPIKQHEAAEVDEVAPDIPPRVEKEATITKPTFKLERFLAAIVDHEAKPKDNLAEKKINLEQTEPKKRVIAKPVLAPKVSVTDRPPQVQRASDDYTPVKPTIEVASHPALEVTQTEVTAANLATTVVVSEEEGFEQSDTLWLPMLDAPESVAPVATFPEDALRSAAVLVADEQMTEVVLPTVEQPLETVAEATTVIAEFVKQPAVLMMIQERMLAFAERAMPEAVIELGVMTEQLDLAVHDLETALTAEIVDEQVLADAKQAVVQLFEQLLVKLDIPADDVIVQRFIRVTIDEIIAQQAKTERAPEEGTHEAKIDLTAKARSLLAQARWQVSFSRAARFLVSASLVA